MEKSKKNLREMSLLILILAGLALIRMIVSLCVNGIHIDAAQAGVSPELAKATGIAIVVASFVALLPQIYVGFKGLKVANGDATGKAHIVWAAILLVFAVISLFDPISAITKNVHLIDNILELIARALDVLIYFLFIKFAREVRLGA